MAARRLIAISQRDSTNYYAHLSEDGVADRVCEKVEAFFRRRIDFPDPDYVFDVVVGENVLLVDFNPFSPVTDALLFTWAELCALRRDPPRCPQVRIRSSPAPLASSSHRAYAFPKDITHLNSAADIEEFAQFAQSLRQ